jgi:hypothetical protein
LAAAYLELFLDDDTKRKASNSAGRVAVRRNDPPILRSLGPKDILLSMDWVARGTVQRIGASILATISLFGAIGLFVGSLVLMTQSSGGINGVLEPISRIVLTVIGLFLSWIAILITIRLYRGVARSFHK